MLLSLLDSPFLPDTHYGEFATGSSRNKRGKKLHFPTLLHFRFCLILASSSYLCGSFSVFLSPLRKLRVSVTRNSSSPNGRMTMTCGSPPEFCSAATGWGLSCLKHPGVEDMGYLGFTDWHGEIGRNSLSRGNKSDH